MPAQQTGAQAPTVAYYVELDTAPKLRRQILDEHGDSYDLTDASKVEINIAWSSPHGSYYTSPRDRIVSQQACDIEVGAEGWVTWTPGTDVGVDALSPPGQFNFQFETFWNDGTSQTTPPNTYQPLIIRSRVGGRAYTP